MAELARILEPTDQPRGPDARLELFVPWGTLRAGARFEIELPRRLVCARCDGGGCDACERRGALSVRAADDAPELVEVHLSSDVREGAVRLRLPGRGGHAPRRAAHAPQDRAAAAPSGTDGTESQPRPIEGSTVEGSTVEGSTVEGSTVEGSTVEGSTVEGSTVEGSTVEGTGAQPSDGDPSAAESKDGEAVSRRGQAPMPMAQGERELPRGHLEIVLREGATPSACVKQLSPEIAPRSFLSRPWLPWAALPLLLALVYALLGVR